jgi:hypothetical protein
MSHVSPDSSQQKKISAKTGDQLPISNISNSNSTESYFKLPLEHHSSSKLNTLVSSLNRGQSSQRRWDHGGHSQVDRWTEISSEDSYSSRPPDYFSTEVSDSSDTTMASNMRTELDRSQKPVTFYPSSSAPQLHRVKIIPFIRSVGHHFGSLNGSFLFLFNRRPLLQQKQPQKQLLPRKIIHRAQDIPCK